MWLQSPFLGGGPDNFRRLYGSYLGLKNFDNRIHANNLYLEALATTGLTGILALIFVLITIANSIRANWLITVVPEDKLLLTGIGAALASFCIHGLVDYFLPFTPTYGLFWLLAGLALGLGRKVESK